jgi:hypothetical protein
VLETLVVEGDENAVLVPGDRYAQMRNVYFIPSALALKNWLEKCGFVDVRIRCLRDLTEEQRRTEWMITESLADFLDPADQQQNHRRLSGPDARGVDCDNRQFSRHAAKHRPPGKRGEEKRPLFNCRGLVQASIILGDMMRGKIGTLLHVMALNQRLHFRNRLSIYAVA